MGEKWEKTPHPRKRVINKWEKTPHPRKRVINKWEKVPLSMKRVGKIVLKYVHGDKVGN